MPKLTNDNLENFNLSVGSYGFSGTKIQELGASEYTLVSLIVDDSGSVSAFHQEMTDCVKEIIKACKYSPRADNLMVRLVTFDTNLSEIHGFKLLSECYLDDYADFLKLGGMTALYDATQNAVSATSSYGKTLMENDFSVNGIVFVITDGFDNSSVLSEKDVRKALESAVREETLESLVSVLIGVNLQDANMKQFLTDFHKNAGFTQFVDIGKATAKTLAKLADFVSKSISAQSQALGTGGPSKPLKF